LYENKRILCLNSFNVFPESHGRGKIHNKFLESLLADSTIMFYDRLVAFNNISKLKVRSLSGVFEEYHQEYFRYLLTPIFKVPGKVNLKIKVKSINVTIISKSMQGYNQSRFSF
jgi:hypothetical protein